MNERQMTYEDSHEDRRLNDDADTADEKLEEFRKESMSAQQRYGEKSRRLSHKKKTRRVKSSSSKKAKAAHEADGAAMEAANEEQVIMETFSPGGHHCSPDRTGLAPTHIMKDHHHHHGKHDDISADRRHVPKSVDEVVSRMESTSGDDGGKGLEDVPETD